MIAGATRARLLRAAARVLHRRVVALPRGFAPTVSFTFDDVPASAVRNAAPLLEAAGMRGTWYVAAGLIGQPGPTGRVLSAHELPPLHAQGHEIGCHTFAHLRAVDAGPRYAGDMAANRVALPRIVPGLDLASFSYPYGDITPGAKAAAATAYVSARTIDRGIARDRLDLLGLPANALYADVPVEAALALIGDVAARPGWLIFYTHDVTGDPSPWGCTPAYFAAVVDAVSRAGLAVRTVRDVAAALTAG